MWYLFRRNPAAVSQQTDSTSFQKKPIRGIIDCAIKKVVSSDIVRDKAKATLDFIGDELAEGFGLYKISSNVRKAHFLA